MLHHTFSTHVVRHEEVGLADGLTPTEIQGEYMEQFITDLANIYGFQRPMVVAGDGFVDLKTLVLLPEDRRGQGTGSKLLEEVCAEADRRGEAVGGYPEGESSKWTKRLVSWYELERQVEWRARSGGGRFQTRTER